MNVIKQKYLGITIDSNFTWAYNFAKCLQEDGILSIFIGCHQKVLPSNIIKVLINSLVFSYFVYCLPVWVLH